MQSHSRWFLGGWFTLENTGQNLNKLKLQTIQKLNTTKTRSQAVAMIADRTAKNCKGHVT